MKTKSALAVYWVIGLCITGAAIHHDPVHFTSQDALITVIVWPAAIVAAVMDAQPKPN